MGWAPGYRNIRNGPPLVEDNAVSEYTHCPFICGVRTSQIAYIQSTSIGVWICY